MWTRFRQPLKLKASYTSSVRPHTQASMLQAHNVDALAAAVERLAAAAAARDDSAAGDSAASEAAREHTEGVDHHMDLRPAYSSLSPRTLVA